MFLEAIGFLILVILAYVLATIRVTWFRVGLIVIPMTIYYIVNYIDKGGL